MLSEFIELVTAQQFLVIHFITNSLDTAKYYNNLWTRHKIFTHTHTHKKTNKDDTSMVDKPSELDSCIYFFNNVNVQHTNKQKHKSFQEDAVEATNMRRSRNKNK